MSRPHKYPKKKKLLRLMPCFSFYINHGNNKRTFYKAKDLQFVPFCETIENNPNLIPLNKITSDNNYKKLFSGHIENTDYVNSKGETISWNPPKYDGIGIVNQFPIAD